jgi:hypothetical protein
VDLEERVSSQEEKLHDAKLGLLKLADLVREGGNLLYFVDWCDAIHKLFVWGDEPEFPIPVDDDSVSSQSFSPPICPTHFFTPPCSPSVQEVPNPSHVPTPVI